MDSSHRSDEVRRIRGKAAVPVLLDEGQIRHWAAAPRAAPGRSPAVKRLPITDELMDAAEAPRFCLVDEAMATGAGI